ncbi:hypothetical protein L6R52_09860 [Myxococcota bacterium]|nr:hypothetical protein [Myxococcota bacterium]
MRVALVASVLSSALCLAPSPAAAADEACRARVAALSKNLASITIGAHVSFATPSFELEVPVAARAELVKKPGVVVEVRGDRLAFDGVPIEGRGKELGEKLDHQLESVLASEAELPEDSPHRGRPMYLAIDRRTKVSEALGPMCLVASKREARLVVALRTEKRSASTAKTKTPAWLEGDLATAATTPTLRGQILSRALDRAIGTCQPIVDRIHALPEDPAGQGAGFKRALVDGLTACRCVGADVDALEALVLRGLADGPARSSIPLAIECDPKSPSTEIALGAAATMTELVAALAKKGLDTSPAKPFRVTLR